MNLTFCVQGAYTSDVKRVSSLLRYLRSFPWMSRKVYRSLALLFCVAGVILFISVARRVPHYKGTPLIAQLGSEHKDDEEVYVLVPA